MVPSELIAEINESEHQCNQYTEDGEVGVTSTPITQTYSNNEGIYIEAPAQVIHRSTEGTLDVKGKSNSKLLIRNNNLKEDGM